MSPTVGDVLNAINECESAFQYPFKSTLFPPASEEDISKVNGPPAQLSEFWSRSAGARLFEDARYGQWGLIVYGPLEAHEHTAEFQRDRQDVYLTGDLVVAEFLGDCDLIIVRSNPEEADFGSVLVYLPMDERPEWYKVADDFATFLVRFIEAGGEKYWEKAG